MLGRLSNLNALKAAMLSVASVAVGSTLLYMALAAMNPNLPGDLNTDNKVDVADLSYLLARYGTSDASADMNNDGHIGIIDLSVLLSNFGKAYVPSGAQLYVSASGSDAGSCTQSAPCRSLARANSLAKPGTTVNVGAGSFAAATLSTSGSSSARIKYVSASKWAALVAANMRITGQYIDFEGFDVSGSTLPIGIHVLSSNVTVKGNRVHNIHKYAPDENGGAAIDVYTPNYSALTNVVVDSNVVYDIGRSPAASQTVQGIYIAVPVTGGKVINNLVYGIEDFGIHAYHNPAYWTVADNTVFNCGRGILAGPGFKVANNISYKNLGAGMAVSSAQIQAPVTYAKNIIFGNGAGSVPSGSIAQDPQFILYRADGSGNYRLSAGSPGLNTGTATDAPVYDITGAARPQGSGFDIGAYEQ